MSTELEELLDQTCDALILGNISGLALLTERVIKLADTLPRLDRPTAERLHRKSDRNSRLLQAAARGVNAAKKRLIEIETGPTLSTYDMQGRREVISAPSALAPRRV